MAHGSRLVTTLVVVVCVLAATAGCSADTGHNVEALHNPTPTTLEPYVEPHFDDTRGVALPPVAPGAPLAFPVTILGGEASLSGTLSGPEGPVAHGLVRLERFVGESSASVEVTTNADGRWNAKGIVGGRYRVRGWRKPDLAMNSSTVLFLGADERRDVELAATLQGEVDVQAALLTTSPTIGQPVTVMALITRHQVEGDGVVRAIPLTGTTATLSGAAGWDIATPDTTVDASGNARWTLTCSSPSPAPLVVSDGWQSVALDATSCRQPAGPTTSVPTPPVPVADFAVGRRFTPPFAGPLPAGTYTIVDPVASCALVYEAWVDGAWSADRVTATGTDPLVVDAFARNLDTLGDAPACTYERMA